MHTSLECSACGTAHDPGCLQNLCGECGKPLLVGYDLAAIAAAFTPAPERTRSLKSLWRFHDVLPVSDSSEAISLGEGGTPLLRCRYCCQIT